MDTDFSSFVSQLWQYKPVMIVLFVGVVILFVILVVDAHRYRKRRKKRHKRLH